MFVAWSSDRRVLETLKGQADAAATAVIDDASTSSPRGSGRGSGNRFSTVLTEAPQRWILAAAPHERLTRAAGSVAVFAGDSLDPAAYERLTRALTDVADDGLRATSALTARLREVPLDVVAVAVSAGGAVTTVSAWTGVPPLYLYRHPHLTIVSSDLDRIVWAVGVLGLSLTLDVRYVARFITAIAPPHLEPVLEPSIYEEVRYLPGAHVAHFADTAGACRRSEHDPPPDLERYWRYWEVDLAQRGEAAGNVREAVVAAVADRLPGAKAGVLLSGGLDSSCVAAAAHIAGATASPHYHNTFSCSPSLEESSYARAVADHLGHELIEIPSDDLWAFRDVPDSSRMHPLAEPYQAWFFAQERAVASQASLDGVDVIFDGFGGDELFHPEPHGGSFGLGHRECHTDRARYLRFMRDVVRGRRSRDPLSSLVLTADVVPVFLTKALEEAAEPASYLPDLLDSFAALGLDAVTAIRVFAFECTHFSVYDRIWANRDVYNRFGVHRLQPFFDRRVVEAVFAAPLGDLLHAALNKPLLRSAMRGTLPPVVLQRRHKVTFEIMERRGIGRGGAELARIRELMQDAMVYELNLVDRDEFRRCFEDVYVPDRHERVLLPALKYWIWQTLTLEVWLRQWASSPVFKPSRP